MLKIVMGGTAKKFKEFIKLMIDGKFDVQFVDTDDANSTVEYLKEFNTYSLVIYDCDFEEENPLELYEYLYSNARIPSVFITKDKAINEIEGYAGFFNKPTFFNIIKPCPVDEFEAKLEKIIKAISPKDEKEEGKDQQVSDFLKVRIDRFQRYSKKRCPLYKRLPSGKFVKILDETSDNEEELLAEYVSRGVREVFLEREDYISFITTALKSLIATLTSSDLDDAKKIKLHSYVITEMRETAMNLGVNLLAVKYVEQLSESILKLISRNEKVHDLVGNFNIKSDYVNNLSQLMMYLMFMTAQRMDWHKEEFFKNYIQACLFCDIGLKNQGLAHIQGKGDEDFFFVKGGGQEDIMGHTERSVQLLENSELPFDVEIDMIKAHHERPDGRGFPARVDANVMSEKICFFNLMHAVSYRVLSSGRWDKDSIYNTIRGMKLEYCKGNYEEAYNALLDIAGEPLKNAS